MRYTRMPILTNANMCAWQYKYYIDFTIKSNKAFLQYNLYMNRMFGIVT